MSQTLGLTALGIANSLGVGKRKVAEALFQGSRAGLRPRADLVPGRTVHVGAIEADLPDLSPKLAPFASRNNRLAQLVLNEIEAEIDAAIAHFGRDRIAVVMGTSTSGIADGETAFAFHAAQGVWPQGYDYRLQETGSLAEFVARSLALTGPAYTIATACSSSGKALAAAARLIRAGFADAALVGGVDSLCKMTVQGFAALEALSRGRAIPSAATATASTSVRPPRSSFWRRNRPLSGWPGRARPPTRITSARPIQPEKGQKTLWRRRSGKQASPPPTSPI